MNADVFLQIILPSALVLTIRATKALQVVRFALMPHEAYFILVLSWTLIATEECFLLL